MKKILLLTIALSAAFCANAVELTVVHKTECALAEEIDAALKAADISGSQVTKLNLSCDYINPENQELGKVDLYWATPPYPAGKSEDCAAIRTKLTNVEEIDFTGASFRYGETGEPQGDGYFLKGLTKLRKVILPEGVYALGGGSFSGCTALQTVVFPENFTTIGKRCFVKCSSLNMPELPEKLKTIYDEAFWQEGNAENLKNIQFTVLPATMENIYASAFRGTNVTFSELPEGLKSIGKAAFREAPVTFSRLPESVTKVEADAFIMCNSIKYFEISGIFETEIPNRVFYIGDVVPRTFVCRTEKAPKITARNTSSFAGSFGLDDKVLEATTFRILKDATGYTGETWNVIKKEYLTTPVEISIVGTGADVAINHQHYADKVFTAGTHDIYEGTHKWTLTPSNSSYYITAVYYEETEPAAAPRKRVITADDNEEADEAEEPVTGKQTLYTAEGTPAVGFIPVQVSVPVTAKAGKLCVEYAHKSGSTTGIDDINAEAAFVRNGNIISVTDGTATLYDLTGKVITTAAEIDMTNLNTGVYILRCGAQSLKIAR